MRHFLCVVSLSIVAFAMSSQAGANILVQDFSVEFDQGSQAFVFTTTYDRAPDMVTADQFGRLKDDLAWDISFTGTDFDGSTTDRALRHKVMTSNPDAIELIDASNWDGHDPLAPLWVLLATTPFAVDGSTVSFSVPKSMFADGVTHAYAQAWTTSYGGWDGEQTIASFDVPEPMTLGLLAIGGLLVRRRS
jgi:hypothetical protein